jgi:hypothetical protein
MATSTETFSGVEGVTVTVTVRTSLRESDGQWVCTCGLSCDDGVTRGRFGTTVNTVELRQAAARHAAECTGIWEVEH